MSVLIVLILIIKMLMKFWKQINKKHCSLINKIINFKAHYATNVHEFRISKMGLLEGESPEDF